MSLTKTKTLCTLGPASDSMQMIVNLIKAGIDGFRLNFSHGTHEYWNTVFQYIEEACKETKEAISVLADLQGPRIRIGELSQVQIELVTGNKIKIAAAENQTEQNKIPLNYKYLLTDASVGDKILIDDGRIRLEVIGKKQDSLDCLILNGGTLKPRKGVNLPGMKLSLPSVTEKDYADLEFLLSHRVDYIALSFVRSPADLREVRDFLIKKNLEKFIIAKIEKQEAVDNFDAILEESDGIMVARGDLGIEIPPQYVPNIQKEIIRKCNEAGKLVITATQMLESMVENPFPTRAEASDVANSVWDGTDVVMLSEETAIGKYPLETLKIMDSILAETESHIGKVREFNYRAPAPSSDPSRHIFDSAGSAVASLASHLNASAIAAVTKRGRLAGVISKYRPPCTIAAFSDNSETVNKLRLYWGVMPVFIENLKINESELIQTAINRMKKLNLLKAGDTVIFASGSPEDEKGPVLWIKVVLV